MEGFGLDLVTSLGVGGLIAGAVAVALKSVWARMWQELETRDKRCQACAEKHAQELRELNAEMRRVLEEVARGDG